MNFIEYYTVIIGSGIAGLYAALKLEQLTNKKVLLITKSKLNESNSYYAQGGMVAVLSDNKNDSVDLHVDDTLKAGAGLSDYETVKFISQNSDDVVKDLLKFGVKFDIGKDGDFKLTKEAAHSVRRILHSGGDATGREMEVALCNAVKSNKNIDIFEKSMAIELLVKDNVCHGVVFMKNSEYYVANSGAIIIATGGLGQIYKYTTNPIGATGDGIALCYEAGAILRDMEFVQFHPTALYSDNEAQDQMFLISEAVRGEGAKLIDASGQHFIEKYDKRLELAPRDIVARANFMEIKKTGKSCVYLDISDIKDFKTRFPNISKKCQELGINLAEGIPVAPAAHYFMGGVKTNLNSETTVKNLFAIGEVASTGLHGANRLASNSLLECVVCAKHVAKFLSKKDLSIKNIIYAKNDYDKKQCIDPKLQKQKLQNIMWNNVGIFRSEESLMTAQEALKKLEIPLCCNSIEEYELKNMHTVAKLITKMALYRKESRGAHYRTDYLNNYEEALHSEIDKNADKPTYVPVLQYKKENVKKEKI